MRVWTNHNGYRVRQDVWNGKAVLETPQGLVRIPDRTESEWLAGGWWIVEDDPDLAQVS